MRVAVLMPTKGRALQMMARVTPLLCQRTPVDVMVVLSVCYDDNETIRVIDALYQFNWPNELHYTVRTESGSNAVQGVNKAYRYTYGYAPDWYVHAHDDLIFNDGWLVNALEVADRTGAQVVGLNDLHTDLDHFSPFWMVTPGFIEQQLGGYFAPPCYMAWWFDREICHKAQALDLYAPAWEAIVEHVHPDWHTAELDDTYREALGMRQQDEKLYQTRKAKGFPVDYVEVLA